MKRSKELVGIPIVSITEGIRVGAVKGLLINPYEKNVEFLLIDEPDASAELKGISFLSTEAIGDFAITVESSCGIIDLLKVNILKDLVDIGLDIFGTKIITNKGAYIGEITEYSINLKDGSLAEFFYRTEGDDTEHSISAEHVITIGKEALIIDDSAAVETSPPPKNKQKEKESKMTPQEELRNFKGGDERTSALSEETDIAMDQVIADDEDELMEAFVSSDSAEKEEVQDPITVETAEIVKEIVEEDDPSDQKTSVKDEDTKDQEKTLSKLVQQQRQYVLGKILIRDIKDENGEILAKENEKVTDEVFYRLYNAGPQKIVEAMTYVKD